jgi:hypothetical protein
MVWMLAMHAELTDGVILLILLLAFGGVGCGIIACLTIRCPECRSKLLWIAVSSHSMSEWLPWLLSVTSCPVCGFTPRLPAVKAQ